ncbi:MAG TPA: hypothetical protein VFJ19_01670 [Nocardioidaceae bacterium]|nr:hypothetical protein [Nocardioidaceae bacterium]
MTTTTLSRAGGACLLGGLTLGAISLIIGHTISSDPATMAAAIADHPTATVVGLAFNLLGAALLVGGLSWWAWTSYGRSPKLATIGGVLGVFGVLAIVFDDAIDMAAALMGASSGAIGGITTASGIAGPLSVLNDVGMILLAVASLKLGVSRAVMSTAIVGTVLEAAGFATATRYLAFAGLVVLLAGLAGVVRTAWVGAEERTAELAGAPA